VYHSIEQINKKDKEDSTNDMSGTIILSTENFNFSFPNPRIQTNNSRINDNSTYINAVNSKGQNFNGYDFMKIDTNHKVGIDDCFILLNQSRVESCGEQDDYIDILKGLDECKINKLSQ